MVKENTTGKIPLVVERIQPEAVLLRDWPLLGGSSALIHAIEFKLPNGELHQVVVRRLNAV